MKPFLHGLLKASLKTITIFLITGSIGFITIAMKAQRMYNDVWKQLGLTLPQAQASINNSYFDGHLYYLAAKNAKNIAEGNREAIVNDLVEYAKKYTASAEFKKTCQEYQDKKSEPIKRYLPAKPTAKTIETIKAEEKVLLEKRLAATEANLNSPNANVKKSATIQVENIKKEITALEDPNNPAVKRKMDMANRNYEYQLKLYNEAQKNFELKYPSDPKPMLKQRLEEILKITADVDYSAELKPGDNGLKIFVNPDYERKPLEWKLAYRAGKPTTEAVRTAAQQWLRELNSN